MSKRRSDPIYGAAIGAGRGMFGFLRVRPHVIGVENIPDAGGAVLAMTHFGYLDFALVEWMTWKKNRRHIRFLAKKGAFDKPLVGWLLRGMKHISVDMAAGAAAYSQAVEALRAGELLGVFPEGGVSASFTVRELKTGAVRMAAEAGVPIIPVAIWGGQRLMTKNAQSSLPQKFGLPVSFAWGAPTTIAPGADPRVAAGQLRTTMQSLLDRLQTSYPDDGTNAWWQPRHLGGSAPTPEAAAIAETERQARKAREAREGREAEQRKKRR